MESREGYSEYMKRQEENNQFWKMHEELLRKYKSDTLPTPKVQWHENDIDLTLQKHKFHPLLLEDGFTVIPDIDIELLLDNMTEDDAKMFRKKQLYSSSFNELSISSVISFWLNNKKLIPPTMLVFDEEYINKIARGSIPTKEIRPIDGKHRLNIAYAYGVRSLPILVWTKQVTLISEKLGLIV